MVCQLCLKKAAQFHIPRIINNEILHVHLCKDCAQKKSSHDISNGLDDKLHFLLEGLLQSKETKKGSAHELKCDVCKTTLKELLKDKILGCPQCYEVFSGIIAKETKKTGTIYTRQIVSEEHVKHVDRLKKELKKAVEIEDFEQAAELRDKIQNIEKEVLFRDN